MSEIERAIAYWEEFEREIDEMPHSDVLEAQREPVKTALTVLRAEIDREKNPLTCDGCKWEFNRSLGSADMCYNCNRMRKKDRYEPKGEPPCTQD